LVGVFSELVWVGRLALSAARVARVLILNAGFRREGPERAYGQLLVGIAQDRIGNAQAPADSPIGDSIARRLEEHTGRRFGSAEVMQYLRGLRTPPPHFIPAFADAYALTVRERRLVAWAHAFSETPRPRTLEAPPPDEEE
jgi:hypothetical protein